MTEDPARTSSQHRLGPVDVIIVGSGPVGAVAACWLGHFGIQALVIEKSPKIWDIPRAVALDHEIMRVFQNLGIAQEVLPHTAPFPASEHFGAQGQLIRRVDMVPPPYPLGYTPSMVFTQPAVEAILRKQAATYADVTVWLVPEVIGVCQDADKVSINVRMQNGTVATARAAYVIACDGASSPIRQMMNLKLDDLGFDEPWMVVDLFVHERAIGKLPRLQRSIAILPGRRLLLSAPRIIGDGRSCYRPAKTRGRWSAKKMSGGCFLHGFNRAMARCGARVATDFTRWSQNAGARGASFSRATPRISNRPSSVRACARGSVT